MRHMIVVKSDGSKTTYILTPVGKTSSAGTGDFISAHRALVAGNIDHLDHIRVVLVAAHGNLDPFGKNGPFLVYATAHGGHLSRDDGFGNIKSSLGKPSCPGFSGDFS